jgi:hypothetical protein
MAMKRVLLIPFFVSFFLVVLLNAHDVYAASTTMGVTPPSGSYGQPFTVSVVIDGHGDKFNAAQATVTLSPALAIKDLILGDCNFSYLKTPSVQNPSFAGVILSSHSTKCTVYTLTLVPRAKGNAAFSLSKTSVKRYGDAANVLSTTSNGSYTLTAALKAPSVLGTQAAQGSQNGLYTVFLKVLSSQNSPVTDATVTLAPVSGKNKQQVKTDAEGTVRFSDLQQGLYDVIVEENNAKVGETIINVSGSNHTLTLAINLNEQNNNPMRKNSGLVLGAATSSPYLIAGILVLGIIVGTGSVLLVIKLKGRKKAN